MYVKLVSMTTDFYLEIVSLVKALSHSD